ncbi:unnamed protein product, partial [Medioppia subpectinata]
ACKLNNEPVSQNGLQIPKGKIFALLGPNGTGKTTLIRVMLGELKLSSGTINVFGKKPGSKGSGIPGPGVGYMPQELALFDYFTIGEILKYYGMIYHMTREEIYKNICNLKELLHLPENSRLINQLSGGQQRRVSIAITMLHKPRLVILDEPTVGVDSLLRHRIWQYLENMCNKNGQTVIITTHYIEEARSAHNVAFMRSGAVLRQSNPQQLMDEYECPTLEDVFLQLCHSKENAITSRHEFKSKDNTEIDLNNNLSTESEAKIHYKNNAFIDWQRIKAMLIKQWIAIKRRPLFMCAYYALTVITMITLNMILAQDIKHIPVGVYNTDLIGDNQTSLSRLFIDSIDPKGMRLTHYPSIDSAVQSVTNGDNYLVFEFRDNFSDSFETRVTDIFDASDESVEESLIHLYVDLSRHILNKSNIIEQMSTLRVMEVFNGDLNSMMVTFMYVGPQMMLFVEFTMGMVLSAFIMINDKSSDIMNRVFVAGVTAYEYIGAHILINIIMGLIQVSVAMIVVFGISVMAVLFPMFFVSGIFWPLEAIPSMYRFIAYMSPVTYPMQSIRNIMVRGWTYTQPDSNII